MLKFNKTIIIVIVLIVGISLADYFIFNSKIAEWEKKLNQSIKENQTLANQIASLTEAYNKLLATSTQTTNTNNTNKVNKEKTQEQLLTEAVSKVAPAVVSIVITKDVPQLEVVYINPFGDDPFFKDFNIRVPQYRQKGTAEQKVGAGTGFIVKSSGYIITNRHVVNDQNAHYTVLLTDGSQKSAQVIYRDNDLDLAILKIEGNNYSTVTFGNSDTLKLGQSVFAIGNALGEYNNSVSVGIISGLNRDITAFGGSKSEKLQGVIQTDAAINPGNSGGPLVNLNSEVIGINVAMASGENIGFAIPINAVKAIINSQIK